MKFNVDLFAGFICQYFSYCINGVELPNELKHADIKQV